MALPGSGTSFPNGKLDGNRSFGCIDWYVLCELVFQNRLISLSSIIQSLQVSSKRIRHRRNKLQHTLNKLMVQACQVNDGCTLHTDVVVIEPDAVIGQLVIDLRLYHCAMVQPA